MPFNLKSPLNRFDDLVEIMKALRTPETGCPWDLEQTYETIAPYTLEEAYEVADAIARADLTELKDELGDLLLQVVFHAQMASEDDAFSITDVIQSINDKMVRRHPHVFGDETMNSADAQTANWEAIKAAERSSKNDDKSALAGVALALPSLLRAEKLQKRAARTGFDWPSPDLVYDKLDEEIDEVKEAAASGDTAHLEEEIGDVLFVAANLARKYKIDPEVALTKANRKFERRFRAIETLAEAEGQVFSELSLDEQEALWQRVKSTA